MSIYSKGRKLLYLVKKNNMINKVMSLAKEKADINDISIDTQKRFYDNFIKAFDMYATDEKKFDMMKKIVQAFYKNKIIKISDNFVPADIDKKRDVILVTTIKNDFDRIRLFLDYYRKIGIKFFLILDNGSTDGTKEYLKKQLDVNLFYCEEEYETYKKEGWVNRLVASVGFGYWYLIVDSDELFDYIGRERNNISQLIKNMEASGYRRGKGLLIDMYSDAPLFSSECDYSKIPEVFSYFDSESYRYVAANSFVSHWEGGPRERILGAEHIWVSKSPLLFFDEQSLIINAHYHFPLIEYERAPYIAMIRHYKYLKSDYEPFKERIKKGNFADKSDFYRKAIDLYNNNENIYFYYEDSKKFTGSQSIRYFDTIIDLFGDSDENINI
ncbi:glycosyltransferase family 2 protein [uncultured Traorella sp.]|uniref:glycosyltransferase family 2 protein n=1 Tax=uncultured Traorella sp. TaxID=1929048 RepID=UPI0025D3EF75|nr:glycosyltransferase family 2 protein [uncultured Traorella sp.]